MKKIRFFSCMLCITFAFSAVLSSCKKEKGNENIQTSEWSDVTYEQSGINLIENGQTEYKVVIPEDAEDIVSTAAFELTEFLYQSSGVRLQTVRDEEYAFGEGEKYISLGDTTMFTQSGETSDRVTVGGGGYIMKTRGNTLLISSYDSYGVLNGVYDMLKYTIGFCVYSHDEIRYEKMDTVPLLSFDRIYTPPFEYRELTVAKLSQDNNYSNRMHLTLTKNPWAAFCHTVVSQFLPYDKYKETDYYGTTNGQQVCFTNENMRLEMVESMKQFIIKNEEADFIQIGMEDNHNMCECENCVADREELGGYGAQQLEFTNKVAEDLDIWLETAYPGREMKYVFFAYNASKEPPAVYNESTKKYEPASEKFRVQENVGVMIAPISLDFGREIDDPVNAAEYELVKAWVDLFQGAEREENIFIYTYNLNAYAFFFPTPNYGVVANHYQKFAEMGAKWLFDQGVNGTNLPCFQELRVYTQTQLMYGSTQPYNEMVEDFMENYYDGAFDKMMEYYQYTRTHFAYLQETKQTTGKVFMVWENKEYWPINTVGKMLGILDEAIDSLAPLKETDPERYGVLYDRIKVQRLSPLYMMFTFYMDQMTQAQKETYLQEFETYTKLYGVKASAEGYYNVTEKIEGWRAEIYG